MAWVKLRCIMGCPGLKSSYREKGLFQFIFITLFIFIFIVVKHFSGSTTEDMMKYIKPPLKRKPDRFIIHAGQTI